MWRLVFFGLLAIVWAASLSVPYAAKSVAIPFLLIAPALFYLVTFLVWIRTHELDEMWPMRPGTLKALDRTSLFVGASMFGVCIAPLKGTIRDFRFDPALAQFDHALFGVEPWRVTHALLGPLTTPIDYFYGIWPLVVSLVTLGVALFAQKPARFFLGLALSWVFLGVILAHALPSAGPIFGPDIGNGFAALRETLNQSAPYSTAARTFLWNAHESGSTRLGSGISAAPSMHCALTFVMCFSAYRTRWFWPAIAYAAFIWIGSVHLGWHYFADGLISLLGVAALWPVVVWLTRLRPVPLSRLKSTLAHYATSASSK